MAVGMPPTPEDAETIRELLDQAGLTLRVDTDAVVNAADLQTNTPTDKLGRYQITGHLGAGGMGEILQVRDEDVGRDMAAKVIKGKADPIALAKFVREAQITGQLEHPNIVPMHELGMTPDHRVYFTMKRVRGDDLGALLTAERETEGSMLHREDDARPSSRRLVADIAVVRQKCLLGMLNIFVKVCDAMEFAHDKSVIHRDPGRGTSHYVHRQQGCTCRLVSGMAWPRSSAGAGEAGQNGLYALQLPRMSGVQADYK